MDEMIALAHRLYPALRRISSNKSCHWGVEIGTGLVNTGSLQNSENPSMSHSSWLLFGLRHSPVSLVGSRIREIGQIRRELDVIKTSDHFSSRASCIDMGVVVSTLSPHLSADSKTKCLTYPNKTPSSAVRNIPSL